ncbi:radical SAM protein [Chloroflexota bacterium]
MNKAIEKENISLNKKFRIACRAISDLITKKPRVISFEITNSCNANCQHCDRGGIIRESHNLQPKQYGDIARQLNPVAVQISGGEPLLRKDVFEIVREIRKNGPLPLIILVTNGALLNREKYLKFKEAGVNFISVSLDFPDKRHDEWRKIPGLFAHLGETLPDLASFGRQDIVLNSAITSKNLPYLLELAEKAQEWGVAISFSAYSHLRTGDKTLSISSDSDLLVLKKRIAYIIKIKKEKNMVTTPQFALEGIYRFFKNGFMPGCRAGKSFLVVTPDGDYMPCSMQQAKYSSRDEMVKDFPPGNSCGGCYVSIRALSEKIVFIKQ